MLITTADRIKELGQKNHMTQADLARKLYVTRASVNAWEMAISVPSSEKIADLCQLFHTSADYLLGLSSEESLPLELYSEEEKEILYQIVSYFDAARAERERERERERES